MITPDPFSKTFPLSSCDDFRLWRADAGRHRRQDGQRDGEQEGDQAWRQGGRAEGSASKPQVSSKTSPNSDSNANDLHLGI